jgi:tetratricopeptide (TPR) repeat protein
MKALFFALFFSCVACLQAQDIYDQVADKVCHCIDSLKNKFDTSVSLDTCLPDLARVIGTNGNAKDKESFATQEGRKDIYTRVYEKLIPVCGPVRTLYVTEKTKLFYKASDNEEANDHYEKGNVKMDRRDYEGAISDMEEALKDDKNFIYAIDHLAICYRQLGDYKKAQKYYEKSLEIFPEGNLAILNTAVLYSLMKDYETSLKYYEKLKFYFEDDPEGFFGVGKLSFILGYYEQALTNLFTAHLMYKKSGSDYVADSKKLIELIRDKLKEMDRSELFNRKAKEFGLESEF